MSSIVEVRGLTKTYGDVKALDGVSFALEADKIYGLLGRNGAGKTTLMHIVTAQGFASGGEVRVFGEKPYENEKVLSRICFIKESQRYPDTFRVRDVFESASYFYPNWDREFAAKLAADFRLPLGRRVKKLSRGMLSAVGIVVGLASRAPLTMFDEPYLGLDAVARSIFYDRLIEDYSLNPRTIVLSTHLIDEVSKLLEHVLVIDGGKVLLDDEADSLRGRAYTVAGAAAKVDAFVKGKSVIHREPFGALASAAVLNDGGGVDYKKASELGLEVAPVSLQQLVVHLTLGQPAGAASAGKEGGAASL